MYIRIHSLRSRLLDILLTYGRKAHVNTGTGQMANIDNPPLRGSRRHCVDHVVSSIVFHGISHDFHLPFTLKSLYLH